MFGFKKKPNNSQNYNFNFMNIYSLLACINSYTIFSLSYLHATIPTFSKSINMTLVASFNGFCKLYKKKSLPEIKIL